MLTLCIISVLSCYPVDWIEVTGGEVRAPGAVFAFHYAVEHQLAVNRVLVDVTTIHQDSFE